ncbi:MAG: adenosylcobinamide-phosphate synthase CbiB [Desulfitobacteriaceae bacterium]|nr:adenosylcobinamide-phosphate synthase CbiB [Desulfitobacteriaceae bacterium]MDD4346680.1 adenosylcobinamide-phosphate synthase CbiB [Desulfitobacteriaceae bacterium]MDD4400585.1 adenosylcobinamide-phosphate synthase CbiB [Desulfitobacteriaceae bacterium]
MHPSILLFAFLIDQIIGDPPNIPHPVVIMGKIIDYLENKLNYGSAQNRRFHGIILTVILVGGSFFLTWGLLGIAEAFHPYLRYALEIYLVSTTIASKSLIEAGKGVLSELQNSDLEQARIRLSWLVSRDTSKSSETDIVRGTIETLAENFVDGILSPLFFAALGGAPLAMAFKAVSTLDSMVGYRNERYENFGWSAAKSDDWANYLPARLCVPILLAAGTVYKLPVKYAWHIWRRDAGKHPSPNGGNPESIVAGLLGIRLGGVNLYHGKEHYRAEMGEAQHISTFQDIIHCLSLIRIAAWFSLIPLLPLSTLIFFLF